MRRMITSLGNSPRLNATIFAEAYIWINTDGIARFPVSLFGFHAVFHLKTVTVFSERHASSQAVDLFAAVLLPIDLHRVPARVDANVSRLAGELTRKPGGHAIATQ